MTTAALAPPVTPAPAAPALRRTRSGCGRLTVGLAATAGWAFVLLDCARQIVDWVQQHFTATTVGGATVYDLKAAQ